MTDLFDIVGQDAAMAQLQRLAGGSRRPHAFIFEGPPGVGRRSAAVGFAKLLLCETPVCRANTGRLPALADEFVLRAGCGQCPCCRGIDAGTAPDLHMVYRQLARYHDDPDVRGRVMQNLGIDVIRQFVIAAAGRVPVGGRGKVFIVLEAELMSFAAQDALLKTLEEPPDGVTIILITTSGLELLPTTRSRCQTVRFGPLPLEFVAEALAREGLPPDQATYWAALTGGSIGRSKRLAGYGLYEQKRRFVDAVASPSARGGGLGRMLLNTSDRLAKAVKSDDPQMAESLAKRQAAGMILALLAGAFRDAMVLAAGASGSPANADQAAAIEALARRFNVTALADILAQLARFEQLLWRNVNAKLLWDNVAVTCTSGEALKV